MGRATGAGGVGGTPGSTTSWASRAGRRNGRRLAGADEDARQRDVNEHRCEHRREPLQREADTEDAGLRRRAGDARVTHVRHLFRAGLGAVALVLAVPAPGAAHAYLVRSSPSARAIVTRPPERVQLWFNERLEPAYSRVTVHGGDGRRVDADDVQVGPAEPRRLSIGVPVLPAGVYTVKYRVLSVDGHIVEAEFAFTVRGSP
jgi:copper resistance protein C